MKKTNLSFILSIFIIFESGCSYYYDDDVETCSYEISSQEDWLPNTVKQSIEFWADKGVFLDQVKENANVSIDVGDTESNFLGQYDIGKKIITLNQEVFNLEDGVDPTLGLRRKCVLAHEMGHSLGMNHVVSDGYSSLMSVIASIGQTDCSWTDEDQAELDRVMDLR